MARCESKDYLLYLKNSQLLNRCDLEPVYIWHFWLRISSGIKSRSSDLNSWDTLYNKYSSGFLHKPVFLELVYLSVTCQAVRYLFILFSYSHCSNYSFSLIF